MTINRNKIIVTLITIAALALMSGPSGAVEPQAKATGCAGPDALQVKVCYRDLNLSHQEGLVTLYKRITHAAKQVCGHHPDFMNLKQSAMYDACRNDAVTHAVEDVGHPGLTALHQKITNGTGSPVLAGTSTDTK